ncbi:MAG: major capsid protein [Gallionella sp.]|nr:major capsid protein [Gallionella sp.]MDP1942118.1 major capsid protein [Gallionella sp.]
MYIVQKLKNFQVSLFLAFALLFAPLPAMAAIDVTAALGTFADVNTAIPLIGAAFLAALGILAAWKLIRGAFA